MTELVKTENSAMTNKGKVSVASLLAQAEEQASSKYSAGVNPYYHHIQCKSGTKGYYDIFKPLVTTEKGQENKLELLNPEVVASHRIIGLEGDIIELKFGLAQNIMKANDVVEGENPYVRCQTTKLELRDAQGELVDRVSDTKPLRSPVFSPKKSNKEPRVPNDSINRNLGMGYTSTLYGQVDPKYAERVGIESVRSCVDCVRSGTNIFIDKPKSEDEPGTKYECKFTGELVMLVRKVAYRVQDPNNLMNSLIKWVDLKELGVENLSRPSVFVIPLTRGDMFNTVGGDYGYHYNLNKYGYTKTLTPLGMLLKDIQRSRPGDINSQGKYFEDIDVNASVFHQVPVQLMLVPLSVPIAAKTHVILAQPVVEPEILNDRYNRAVHAWYVYTYEKGISNGTLDSTSDYPEYNPSYTKAALSPETDVEKLKPDDYVINSDRAVVHNKVTEPSREDTASEDDKQFWNLVRKSTRQE